MTYNNICVFLLIHYHMSHNQLSNCANDIKDLLISNNIPINASKTKLFNISPSHTYFPPFSYQ